MLKYAKRIKQEIKRYAQRTKIHDPAPIRKYWAGKYLKPKLQALGYDRITHLFLDTIAKTARAHAHAQVISIGSGNCDFEISLAKSLNERGVNDIDFACLELNPAMIERGQKAAENAGLHSRFRFIEDDFNSWIPDRAYHIAIANHSLHHVVELEHLFDGIYSALHPDGYFLINDMIGRNGHMRWPEAERIVNYFWQQLDVKYKYNHQLRRTCDPFLNWDCSVEGFEGIRAQDILPLLIERFHFPFFFGFANVISPFVSRSYGRNFDLANKSDLTFIDRVAILDEILIELGTLTPTQMFAALASADNEQPVHYKHLSAQFCVRSPGQPAAPTK